MTKTLTKPGIISFFTYMADFQGCGYIRVIFPSLLVNQFMHKKFTFVSAYNVILNKDPNFYRNITFVKFQRSCTDKQLETIKELKKIGVNFIYETDDLLKGIPEWNFAHEHYKNLHGNIEEIIKMSKGVTVSTEFIKNQYKEFNNNIVVTPNFLPKYLWGDVYPKHLNEPRERKPVILWAGSQNHFALQMHKKKGISGGDFGEKLLDFIRKTTDKYQWVLCGGFPTELDSIKNKITYHKWAPILEYPQFLKSIEPDICIAPLEMSEFNKSKSDLKVLESLALGCPGVYTDIEPYKKTKMKAETEEHFIDCVERLASNIDLRKKVFDKDYLTYNSKIFWEDGNNIKNYINNHLSLMNLRLPI